MLIITIYTLYTVILTHKYVDEYVFAGVDIHYFIDFCVISHVSYTVYEHSHTISQKPSAKVQPYDTSTRVFIEVKDILCACHHL